MERYQVILAYDGTEFCGFQRQANNIGAQSVQGVVESALTKIGWQGRSILAAGRTDSGVHATGQVIAFDMNWRHSLEALQAALNANLPPAVVARSLSRTHPAFHPRYDAIARCYHYHIYCQPLRDPLKERYSWQVWPAPDLDHLQTAVAALIGERNFAAFGTPPRAGGSTIRKVMHARWRKEGADMIFEIHANAFLYHMVRRLVSFQVEVGQGRHDVAALQELVVGGAEELVQGLAPPQGLVLVEVIYR